MDVANNLSWDFYSTGAFLWGDLFYPTSAVECRKVKLRKEKIPSSQGWRERICEECSSCTQNHWKLNVERMERLKGKGLFWSIFWSIFWQNNNIFHHLYHRMFSSCLFLLSASQGASDVLCITKRQKDIWNTCPPCLSVDAVNIQYDILKIEPVASGHFNYTEWWWCTFGHLGIRETKGNTFCLPKWWVLGKKCSHQTAAISIKCRWPQL